MAVKPVPEGFHTVTPYLVVSDAIKQIDFIKQTFDAKEIHRSTMPDGTVMHAQLQIGDSMIMLGQAGGPWKALPGSIYVYLPNADAVYARALKSGGTSLMPMTDQFYGDRHGGVTDPCGNQWWIATHIEDVAPAELERRTQEAIAKRKAEKK